MNKIDEHLSKAVSVVIPTFNGLKLLQKNLPQVVASLRSGDELVIVDDAGTDHSLDWLQQLFQLSRVTKKEDQLPAPESYILSPPDRDGVPYKVFQSPYRLWKGRVSGVKKSIEVTVIENRSNVRFAASVNRGVVQAKHPYIFLLNNDVSPEPNVLQHLLPHFTDPTVFAVGCLEIEENEGGKEGGKNELWFDRGMFMHSRARDFSSGPTAWASGGSSLFDREKWLALGGFDLDFYPAYWEDVDLSFRARQKKWKVLFERQAVVHHNHESTNNDVFGQKRIAEMSWTNAQKFALKHASLPQRLQYWLWQPYWMWQHWKQN